MKTKVNEKENWIVIEHNGKTIHIEFVDYVKGDQNQMRVTISQDNYDVVICDENIQSEF